jgi:hypothetical protein
LVENKKLNDERYPNVQLLRDYIGDFISGCKKYGVSKPVITL